jgi:carboxyl-terminal processing protease
MDTREMDAESAVSCLRGKNGVDITLDVLAGDSAIQLTFVRKSVNTQVVFSDMLESGVGYIDIMEFSGSAESNFRKELKTMADEDARAIIIDIRNVPGGYISQASAIADMLIESGDIYTTKGRDNAVFTISAKNGRETELPIYLLVNEDTKGVAEVFAAALKENGIAKVIGTQTYGKGVVMSTLQVPNSGDGVRLVTAFYYSPKGNPINGAGVTPDEVVADAAASDEEQHSDPQLDKALEIALADLDK